MQKTLPFPLPLPAPKPPTMVQEVRRTVLSRSILTSQTEYLALVHDGASWGALRAEWLPDWRFMTPILERAELVLRGELGAPDVPPGDAHTFLKRWRRALESAEPLSRFEAREGRVIGTCALPSTALTCRDRREVRPFFEVYAAYRDAQGAALRFALSDPDAEGAWNRLLSWSGPEGTLELRVEVK